GPPTLPVRNGTGLSGVLRPVARRRGRRRDRGAIDALQVQRLRRRRPGLPAGDLALHDPAPVAGPRSVAALDRPRRARQQRGRAAGRRRHGRVPRGLPARRRGREPARGQPVPPGGRRLAVRRRFL
ncbi:MAG: UPF0225 protein YchJ, partial [uncultured Blastococcus sp.]